MDLWDHSVPNCCAKSIIAINLRQKCAPNFVRVASGSAPKIFRKYTLKFTLGKMYKLMKI
jgi:hypothetical protein